MGDVMKESTEIAFAVARKFLRTIDPANDFFDKWVPSPSSLHRRSLFLDEHGPSPAPPIHTCMHTYHTITGPSHTITGPSHTIAGPYHTITGPSHTITGPSHTMTGPSYAEPGL